MSDTVVHDLFDLNAEQSTLDDRVTEFLSRVDEAPGAQPPRDVIIYYVGHGYFSGRTTSCTPEDAAEQALLRLSHQGAGPDVAGENARYSRRYLLLDCCFAAKAVAEFQGGGPLQAGAQKTVEEFEGQDPGRGTALLCASGPTNPARTPLGAPCTMFTTALIDVLRN